MKIRPLFDRVVIKSIDSEETTKSGIILTAAAKEKPQEAEVISVGPGGRDDKGALIEFTVKPGDHVLISKYGGTEVTLNGEKYMLLREDDTVAILK